MNTVYHYIPLTVKAGTGHICIRVDRPPKEATGPFTYQASFALCSPKDQFSRRVARHILDSRMANRRGITEPITVTYDEKPKWDVLCKDLVATLVRDYQSPRAHWLIRRYKGNTK